MQIWIWISGAIARLFIAFKLQAAGITARVLATMGLTWVSFDAVLPQLKAFVLNYASGLSAEAMNFLGYLGVGEAMSMVFSALTVRLAGRAFLAPKAAVDALQGNGS